MSQVLSFPSENPLMELSLAKTTPKIFVLTFLGSQTPDNRLTHGFVEALLAALAHIDGEWNNLDSEEQRKGAALVTTGLPDGKFYSNGLDLEAAISDPTFFDTHINKTFETLLTFPIPTIASIGGHCFAAGLGLAMTQDYRVFNATRGYLCMNEIDFGAQIFPGLYASLSSKITSTILMRRIILEGHRFGGKEALEERMVDVLAPAVGESGGAKKTLEAAIELAERLALKAGADCYGSNKLNMYAAQLAILRTSNEVASAKL